MTRSSRPLRFIGLLCAVVLTLTAQNCPPVSGKPATLRVTNRRVATQSDMIITGHNFTPNRPITITIHNFPHRDGEIISSATTDNDGAFTRTLEFRIVTVSRDEEFARISVAVRDDAGKFAAETASVDPYIVRQ